MQIKRCINYDEDCRTVKDKWVCWLYDITLGYCPYICKNSNQQKRITGIKTKHKENYAKN